MININLFFSFFECPFRERCLLLICRCYEFYIFFSLNQQSSHVPNYACVRFISVNCIFLLLLFLVQNQILCIEIMCTINSPFINEQRSLFLLISFIFHMCTNSENTWNANQIYWPCVAPTSYSAMTVRSNGLFFWRIAIEIHSHRLGRHNMQMTLMIWMLSPLN